MVLVTTPFTLLAQESKPDVEIINDRFIKIDGKVYGYAPKDKYIQLKTDVEKLSLKEQRIELLERKVSNKDEIIESKDKVVQEYKQHSELMTKSFNRFSENESKGFFENEGVRQALSILSHTTVLMIGAKIGAEATQ